MDRNSKRKKRMRMKKYSSLRGRTICVFRGVKATRWFKAFSLDYLSVHKQKRCFYGGIWFGSEKTISNITKNLHCAALMMITFYS